MWNKIQYSRRSDINFVLMSVLLVALFLSRALLSVSLIAFLVFCFSETGLRARLQRFLHTPLLWGMSLLFVVPLLSGCWSTDTENWAEILRIKLPLLLLPLAFAGKTCLSKEQWPWLGYVFIGTVTAATLWSFFQYLPDAAAVNESYLRAKSLATPLGNDHVRFSWLVAMAILTAGVLLWKRYTAHWLNVFVLLPVIVWLIVYLHLLAARTGLVTFYILLILVAAALLIRKGRRGYAWLFIGLLVALPLAAYRLFPSFHNRVQYILYDSGFFTKGHYSPGSTDAVRVISLQAGWQLMNDRPFTGTGFGDLLSDARTWYDQQYPGMLEADKIYPSGEWMIYGAGAGWPGFILFSLSMILPFFTPVRHRLPWIALNGTAAFSFLFDIGLEAQYGVFLYGFLVLTGYRWIKEEEQQQ